MKVICPRGRDSVKGTSLKGSGWFGYRDAPEWTVWRNFQSETTIPPVRQPSNQDDKIHASSVGDAPNTTGGKQAWTCLIHDTSFSMGYHTHLVCGVNEFVQDK